MSPKKKTAEKLGTAYSQKVTTLYLGCIKIVETEF